ncbi:hypothetical protein JCM5296_005450, partial [Sporobolomyces johnsonii]
ADAESIARAEGLEAPSGTGDDADVEVLERKLRHAKEEAEALEHILQAKRARSPTTPPRRPLPETIVLSSSSPADNVITLSSSPPPLVLSSSPSFDSSAYVDIAAKKVSPPKPWSGVFDYFQREAWLTTAEGYWASQGITMLTRIHPVHTPIAWYQIRSLSSSERRSPSSPTSQVSTFRSPLSWFDGRHAETPFKNLSDVVHSVRAHWCDDNAAEVAFRRFRNARQGSLRIREFGSMVIALANECFDRTISDADRAAQFWDGLQPRVRDWLREVRATQDAISGTVANYNFDTMLRIASRYDSLEATKSHSVSSPSESLSLFPPTPKRNPRTDATVTPSPRTEAREPRTQWLDLAVQWQTSHAVRDKSTWFRPDRQASPRRMRCYNCGKEGSHYSDGCPNPRQDPKSITIAS